MLNFGIIGISEGNGHLFSWSAICNGYDAEAMASCPFPLIPNYLGKESWPEAQLGLAKVTHVWTQDPAISRSASESSLIPTVCDRMEDLVGKVDAILLARDDSENHYEMALPFLRAGLPVYVDKPFAPTKAEAHRIFDEEQYPGQLYSCSALRFSGNLRTQAELQEEVGELRYIRGVSPSKWKTYSPHIVEPVLDLLGFPQTPPEVHARPLSVGAALQVSWNGLPSVHWACLGDGVSPYPFSVEVFGTKGSRRMDLNDYFHSFKRALEVFAVSVRDRGVGIPKEQTLQVIEFVERGAS